ncbi:DUF2155 domain-containing protein [Rhodobacterales bacterium HKCCE2091]|nr:DUF2155 domain-containing protein [Rhodobacterales bacterium HKCCE2091]
MGLEPTRTPIQQSPTGQNPDSGIVTEQLPDGVFVQIDPGGQDGVALVQAPNPQAEEAVSATPTGDGRGATIRALDKTIGQPTDIEMTLGETVVFGRIAIHMVECRYPADNPASDAFAHVQIADLDGQLLFDGWMVASSPALMALEHPRYDVWVLSCRTT